MIRFVVVTYSSNVFIYLSLYIFIYFHISSPLFIEIPEPTADLFENVMRFCQMLVQAVELPFQPFWQVPHFTRDTGRFIVWKVSKD